MSTFPFIRMDLVLTSVAAIATDADILQLSINHQYITLPVVDRQYFLRTIKWLAGAECYEIFKQIVTNQRLTKELLCLQKLAFNDHH